jgi:uncharacterized protein (DUF302 family)
MPGTDDVRTISTDAPFERALQRLRDVIHDRGLTLFAEIDHARNARDEGLEMPETRVMIFGSAKAGTPLMLAAPDVALDLPLRILIRAQPDGTVALVYRDPVATATAFGIEELAPAIAGVGLVAQAAAG